MPQPARQARCGLALTSPNDRRARGVSQPLDERDLKGDDGEHKRTDAFSPGANAVRDSTCDVHGDPRQCEGDGADEDAGDEVRAGEFRKRHPGGEGVYGDGDSEDEERPAARGVGASRRIGLVSLERFPEHLAGDEDESGGGDIAIPGRNVGEDRCAGLPTAKREEKLKTAKYRRHAKARGGAAMDGAEAEANRKGVSRQGQRKEECLNHVFLAFLIGLFFSALDDEAIALVTPLFDAHDVMALFLQALR